MSIMVERTAEKHFTDIVHGVVSRYGKCIKSEFKQRKKKLLTIAVCYM